MEFYDYTSTYDFGRRLPGAKKVTPSEYYRGMQRLTAAHVLAGDDLYRPEHNRCVAEGQFYDNGQPYYKVHPGVLDTFLNVKLDVPIKYLKLPFSAFLVRLPVEENPLIINDTLRVQSILVHESNLIDGSQPRMYLWIDTNERDEHGGPVISYQQLPRDENFTIEEAYTALPKLPVDLTDEQARQCVRLAVSICFLATGSDKLISPDVLGKDFAKWVDANRRNDAGAKQVIEERAKRRGKIGWNVGYGERILPMFRPGHIHGDFGSGRELSWQHQRGSHFRHYKDGKVVFIRQMTIRPDLPPAPVE